jgi:hypothetical protein
MKNRTDICLLKSSCRMINPTKHSLQKLETLFQELGYVIRYEKGNFNSGYCLVEHRKIVVINKFYETEGRVNTLIDVLQNVEFEPAILSEKSLKFFKQIREGAVEERE